MQIRGRRSVSERGQAACRMTCERHCPARLPGPWRTRTLLVFVSGKHVPPFTHKGIKDQRSILIEAYIKYNP